jgi:alcohol dehydrogenase
MKNKKESYMRAAQINDYGGPEVIGITEVPEPTLAKEMYLVDIFAASINPFDIHLVSGAMKDRIPLQLPVTLGSDFAGKLIKVPEGQNQYHLGDEVYGQASILSGNSGAWAEKVAVKALTLAHKPSNVSFIEAASLPLVGTSALQALNEHLHLTKGQKILIHGGSGGIGSVAIQLAKHLGAIVATTVSSAGIEKAKEFGTDLVINYRDEDFTKMVKDYDAVFDTVGGVTYQKSFVVLKKGGTIVSMVMPADQELMAMYGVNAIHQFTHSNHELLEELSKLVETGVVITQVDQTFPLDKIQEAVTVKTKGGVIGKVVIEIQT